MKNSVTFIRNRMAAMAGRTLLAVYSAYSSLFRKKERHTPFYPPMHEREIILVKRTGYTYSVASQQYSLQ